MVWFQCEDCGENLKKPKLPNHFRICSANKLSCIDCGEVFSQQSVQSHTQCISEAEKYGPKGQGKASHNVQNKPDKPKHNSDVNVNVGLSSHPPWFCRVMEGGDGERNGKRHKGKHDKPKPWDEDPNIDHWKIEKFDPSWNDGGMLEVSSFSTLFPQYREKYLQEAWPIVKRALKEYDVSCELNLVEGSMTVATTRKTRDPYIIVKARDLIKLLSRSVPAPQAIKILNDEMQCDIIKIRNLIRNKERFVKRRQHLLGPNLSTLKAIEILTGCYVLVQGNTVAAMGSFKGLKQVRRIVEDCIHNVLHPVYHIKTLLMKRELAKNLALANESWDRFLPKFKKKNVKQRKVKSKEKKPYTPFPPQQQPSKIDLQLESGEYFLSDTKKSAKKWQEKQEKQAEKTAENKRKREAAFVPPKEPSSHVSDSTNYDSSKNEVATMAMSLKEKAKEFKKQEARENINVESYIANTEKPPKKLKKSSKRS